MKTKIKSLKISCLLIIFAVFYSCTKDVYLPSPNSFVKKIVSGGYVVGQYSYNKANLISEVNSTSFYRKFYYDDKNKLIKEEIGISPNSLSSVAPTGSNHEFVDPAKNGISMYSTYEYSKNGNLDRQLNYVQENGEFVFRSMRTFEFDDNNMISKILLHNSDSTVTQYFTYQYDSKGNVTQEDYFTYLFIPAGTGPKLLITTTYEYDTYYNPYVVFKQSGYPGINSNRNNIIKTSIHNYEPSSGVAEFSESVTTYVYNYLTGYPVKVIDGEEFIYD